MTAPIEPTEDVARIAPLDTATMKPEWLAILDRIPGDGLKGAGFPHHVLGTLMHSPDTFGEFMQYWVTCKQQMRLSVREQELVILRMAVLFRAGYVWKHHVPVGREFGIDDAELDAVRRGDTAAFGEREAALLTLTDEMVEHRTVRREVWDRCAGALDAVDVVDLVSLVAQYVLFALMNNVAQVQIEAPLDDVVGLDEPIVTG